jgi:hypothetical protein
MKGNGGSENRRIALYIMCIGPTFGKSDTAHTGISHDHKFFENYVTLLSSQIKQKTQP